MLGNARVNDPTVADTGAGSAAYFDRGAFEFQAPLTNVTVQAVRTPGGGPLDVTVTATLDNPWNDMATFTFYLDGGSKVITTSNSTVTFAYTFTHPDVSTPINLYVTDAANRPEILAGTTLTVGAGYTALPPTRILDTRAAIGVPTTTPIGPDGELVLQVTGVANVPATGVKAVVINLTGTQPTSFGYLSAYPDGVPTPNVSNVNFVANATRPNLVTVAVTDGKIRIHHGGAGTIHVVADMEGYYADAGSGFAAVNPVRVLDTRAAIGVPGTSPVPSNGTIQLDLSSKIPSGATAVVLNVTETQPALWGFLTVYPSGEATPNASNLNFAVNDSSANLVIVPYNSSNGALDIYDGEPIGSVQFIFDLEGYFAAPSP